MIGNMIGGCRMVEAIGQGAYGTVFKAVQISLDRLVAVKILQRHTPEGEDSAQVFDREARIAAKLSHPNIVRVYDYGCDGTVPYIIMECISGKTLDKLIATKAPMEIDEAFDIIKQIASGLDYAHGCGVVHSDLNPRNIMLTPDNRAIVSDFFGWSPSLTAGRKVIGVPEYVSPEQARGKNATDKSDLYSIGIILYEMLSGKPPFSEQAPADTLFKQVSADPEPLNKIRPDIPAPLNNMVLQMLSKNPDVRQESCREIVREIETIQSAMHSRKSRESRARRAPVSRFLAVGMVLVMAAIGGVGYLIQQSVVQERKIDALASAPPRIAPDASLALSGSLARQYDQSMTQGKTYLKQDSYRAAATAFHTASKLKPDEVDPHLFLASVFIERGDYGRARAELRVVLKADPKNETALNAMAYIDLKTKPK